MIEKYFTVINFNRVLYVTARIKFILTGSKLDNINLPENIKILL